MSSGQRPGEMFYALAALEQTMRITRENKRQAGEWAPCDS
jgi:hypothetical protein